MCMKKWQINKIKTMNNPKFKVGDKLRIIKGTRMDTPASFTPPHRTSKLKELIFDFKYYCWEDGAVEARNENLPCNVWLPQDCFKLVEG